MRNSGDEAAPSDALQPHLRTIALAWLAIGLAWAPAVYLMDPSRRGLAAFAEAAVQSVASFLPWIAVTPWLLALGEKAMRSAHPRRNGALLVSAAVIALPVLNLVGRLCSLIGSRLAGFEIGLGTAQEWIAAVTITSLFALPTWLAVVAIALALATARRMAERDQALAEARLAALRAELNPHFLFNTLGGIAQLAHQAPDEAELAIAALADIMRASLAERSRLRPLADEIGAVRDHVELHRVLIDGVMLTLEIDPATWRLLVPTHMLTPLLENATTHGRPGADGSFAIGIAAELAGEELTITVRNPVAPGSGPSHGLGSGLANLAEQLRAIHGSAARLETRLDNGEHIAVLHLPCLLVDG